MMMMHNRTLALVALFLSFLCTACASRPDAPAEPMEVSSAEPRVEPKPEPESDPQDPFEGFNRVMYDFNFNVLDKYIVRPAAVFYSDYVPRPVQSGAYNLVLNLDEPSSAVNNVLQANWSDSANNVGRFVINSTVGLLGVIDVASHLGMERKLDSFGEVLGKNGVGNGPYLMLPAAGPTTPRKEVGDYVDEAYWPLAALNFWQTVTKFVVKGLHTRAQLLGQEKVLEESLDPYSFVKESYLQNLEFKVYDGNPPAKEPESEAYLDDFMDELE